MRIAPTMTLAGIVVVCIVAWFTFFLVVQPVGLWLVAYLLWTLGFVLITGALALWMITHQTVVWTHAKFIHAAYRYLPEEEKGHDHDEDGNILRVMCQRADMTRYTHSIGYATPNDTVLFVVSGWWDALVVKISSDGGVAVASSEEVTKVTETLKNAGLCSER